MNVLLEEQNIHYQDILLKFLDSLEEIPMHSKSRKEYCIPYTSLLHWIGDDNMLLEIQKTKDKETWKQVVINTLMEKSKILSKLLLQQIKSHNIMFVRLLDRFNETDYAKQTKKIKRNKVHFDDIDNNNEHDEYSLKAPERNILSNINSKLPVYLELMLQSSRYKKMENYKLDDESLPENVYDIFNGIFHSYIYNKKSNHGVTMLQSNNNQESNNQQSSNDINMDSTKQEIENLLLKAGILSQSDVVNSKQKDNLIDIVEMMSVMDKYVTITDSIYIINIEAWDKGISMFSTMQSSEKDFCQTSLFELMYQSWFPWCKSKEMFLDMLFISKCMRRLNYVWYTKRIVNDSTMFFVSHYKDIMLNDSMCLYLLFERIDSDKLLGIICIYLKTYYNYSVNIAFFTKWLRLCTISIKNHKNENGISMQFLDYLTNFCNVFLLSENGIFKKLPSLNPTPCSIIALWDLASHIQLIGLTQNDDNHLNSKQGSDSQYEQDILLHTHLIFAHDCPLLSKIPYLYDIQWVSKWDNQYWPSFEDIWYSYEKYDYCLPGIIEGENAFLIRNINILKGTETKRAYEKAYHFLRIWPEIDYEQESLLMLVQKGMITCLRDILNLLMMEKKMFNILQATNISNWIEVIHDGFKSENSILRCSDVFVSKKGWNFDAIGKFITASDIEYFGFTPEDVCYICIRLMNVLSSIGINMQINNNCFSQMNNQIEQSIYVSCATKLSQANSTKVLKLATIDLNNKTLLTKLNNTGQVDMEYFKTMLNNQVNGIVSDQNTMSQNDNFIVRTTDLRFHHKSELKNQSKTVKTYRPLPYPITLNEDTVNRLGFASEEGEAVRRLDGGRYEILIHIGNRTAKLYAIKDFQWNDLRYLENTETGEVYEKEKDKITQSAYTDNFNNSIPHYSTKKYYKPTFKDRHSRATFFYLYHPSSRTSIIPFITFLNIHLDSELQDAYYELVCNVHTTCLLEVCVLRRMCYLLWNIYIHRNIPPSLTYLNREISFDYKNFIEKLKHYYPNCDNFESDDIFSMLMSELYKKLKWHKNCPNN